MNYRMSVAVTLAFWTLGSGSIVCAETHAHPTPSFPRALDSYGDDSSSNVVELLTHRIASEPFNAVATLIFLAAIIHTFLASKFMRLSHRLRHEHAEKISRREADLNSVDMRDRLFHFLGEVEVVFGLWAVVLMTAIAAFYDWSTVIHYVGEHVDFREAAFVVVIMTLAATRPILKSVESLMRSIAKLFGGSLTALWLTVLTIGPILGSFITEPAAMTICALLLSRNVYALGLSTSLKYATLGLLFVNVSVGGTLTNFSAPPVLMVAGPWGWDTSHMLTSFGWKAVTGIVIANGLYFVFFRKELTSLEHAFRLKTLRDEIEQRFVTRSRIEAEFRRIVQSVERERHLVKSVEELVDELALEVRQRMESEVLPELKADGIERDLVQEAFQNRFQEVRLFAMRRHFPGLLPEDERPEFVDPDWDDRGDAVPIWVTTVHVLFMAWTILNVHHPQLFILGMLFFLGFAQITVPYQNRVRLQPAMLVGFFLAGLVIHGGVQGWWIAPVLGSLTEFPLMLSATLLTALNDNAAITYLSTLVPGFTDGLKYAVVAGAVTGGGLTIIANAPNPAGQSILKRHFDDAVSPLGLLKAAILPTIIVFLCFALL